MKKRALLSIILFLLIFNFALILAQNETIGSDQTKIDKAYTCLNDKVKGKCGDITSTPEKIFALMATGECKDEVLADSVSEGEYWTSANPSIKTTAQAILALSKTTTDTSDAEDWLLSQNTSPDDIEWYLQIDSNKETTCTIKYPSQGNENGYKTTISEDKTLNQGAGSCLSLSSGDFWLKVSPPCYGEEFEISCDEAFQTNLLFKRQTSSTVHVPEITSSASAQGTTREKIESACFKQGVECDYEGSLWAALALDSKGHNIDAYLPYLTTFADENPEYLPDAFLFLLTGNADYRVNLLLKQKDEQFWDEGSNNKFYDTAVALQGLSGEVASSQEKVDAKNWLLDVQDDNGCWQGSILETSFILSAVWPKDIAPSSASCEISGYNCLAATSCEGTILGSYSCPGILKCCDTPPLIQTCAEQTGNVCNSNEQCVGGTVTPSSGLGVGENCCLGGTCQEVVAPAQTQCETSGGTCRPVSCNGDEEETASSCTFGDLCCVPQEKGGSIVWIVLLIILIILVTLGIIFRKKLKPYYDKLINKFKKKPTSSTPQRRPLGYPSPMRRPIQRRILPPQSRAKPRTTSKKNGEVSDVLKKLKEMSK